MLYKIKIRTNRKMKMWKVEYTMHDVIFAETEEEAKEFLEIAKGQSMPNYDEAKVVGYEEI